MAIVQVGEDLIDEETGEYAGPANTTLPDALETIDDVIAFLHRLMQAQSRLESKRMELDSIIEHCRTMVKREEDRVNWLLKKHESNARLIAMSELPRRKDGSFASKTFTCPWGKISYVDVMPSVYVTDEAKALEWCRIHKPDAIKVSEKILVTPLKSHFIEGGDLVDELPDGFALKEGRQSATIKTIVESKANAGTGSTEVD